MSHHLKWPPVWFAAALPGPAAAPAHVCGQGRTAHRPLSAGRRSATAGSSPEPGGGEMHNPDTYILYSMHFHIKRCSI